MKSTPATETEFVRHPFLHSNIAGVRLGDDFSGTAFVVGPRALLTCRHVVHGCPPNEIFIVFNDETDDRHCKLEYKATNVLYRSIKQAPGHEADIALLITEKNLPSPGMQLVEGYGPAHLTKFLTKGAKVSGYVDGEKKLREQNLGRKIGTRGFSGEMIVTSFQVEGGIPKGMSGSPCFVSSAGCLVVIGMALTGGSKTAHSGLVSSTCLVEFLRGWGEPDLGFQHIKAADLVHFGNSFDDEEIAEKLKVIADHISEQTEEIDLVGRKYRLLSDDPLKQLFQPLPLLREVSEEDQEELADRLHRRPTATEMTAFDPQVIDRAKEYVRSVPPPEPSPAPPLDHPTGPGLEKNTSFDAASTTIDQIFEGIGSKFISPRVIFLGPPGGGKSVILKYFAQSFAHARRMKFRGQEMLPILIRLSYWCDYATGKGSTRLQDYLASEFSELTADQWEALLQEGRILLLLDGLDEVHDPEERFVDNIMKRALNKYELCPAAITCRTFAFLIYRRIFKNFAIYGLGTLTEERIINYTRAYTHALRLPAGKLERRIRATIDVPSLFLLSGNPLLLSVMCFVLGDSRTGIQPLSVRAQLFNDAVSELLARPRNMKSPLSERPRQWRRQVLEYASLDLFERQTGQDKAVILQGQLVIPAFEKAAKASHLAEHDGTEILRDAIERGLIGYYEIDRSKTIYSFLHLQFHEYLAACALLTDSEFVSRVFDRLSSPRWREVILLAIGQLAIEGSRGGNDFLKTIVKLVEYPDPFANFLPRAALLLVTAIPDLSALPSEMIETIAEKIIDSYSDADRIRNFPALARQLEQAFAKVAALDDGERVVRILKHYLSNIHSVPSKGLAAACLVVATRLYKTEIVHLLSANYHQDQSDWGWPIDRALREIASDSALWDLLDFQIPFRALRNNMEQWQRFSSTPFWNWVAVVLLGGQDAGKAAALRDMQRRVENLERALRREQDKTNPDVAERDRLQNKKKEVEDQIKTIKSALHEIAPQYFHRPSPLVDWLWEVFEKERPIPEALDELLKRLPKIADEHERIDAILCLAFSVSIPSLIAHVRDSERFVEAISRLDAALEILAGPAVNDAIGASENSLLELTPEERHSWLITAVSRACWRYTTSHPFTLNAADSISNPDARAARIAEFLHRSFHAQSDDRVYNWCVVLDTVGGKLGKDPEILMLALASAHHAGNAKSWDSDGWPLDPLAPQFRNKPLQAQLGQALDVLAAIPDTLDFVRSWALARLAPLLRAGGLIDESKLFAYLSLSHRLNALMDALFALADDSEKKILERGMIGGKAIFMRVLNSDDPYLQCRLSLALRRFWLPIESRRHTAHDFASAARVTDPVLRGWLFEQLHQVVEPEYRNGIVEALKAAANEIGWDDSDNKTRALLRLAAFKPAAADPLFAQHLQDLDEELCRFDETNSGVRAQALATLQPYVRGRRGLEEKFETALEKISSENLKLAARGLVSSEILNAFYSRSGSATTVLAAAAVLFDFRHLLQVPDDVDGSWLALTTADRGRALDKLSASATKNGLLLTRAGSFALARLIQEEDWDAIRKILVLLHRIDPMALPLIKLLCQHGDSVIRTHSILLYAECVGLRDDTLPILIDLLTNDEYVVRCRAALAMHGDRTGDTLPLLASQLGSAVLEELACRMEPNRLKDLRTTLVLRWTVERIIFDDPEMVRAWAAIASDEKIPSGSGILMLLGSMESVSLECWTELLSCIRKSSPAVRRALLTSVCALANRGYVQQQQLAEFAEAINGIDLTGESDFYFIEDGPREIVIAAEEVLDQLERESESVDSLNRRTIASACRQAFTAKKKSLSDVLRSCPSQEWPAHLALIGSLRKAGSHLDRKVTMAAEQVEKRPEIIHILVPWLLEELVERRDARRSPDFVYLTGDLLCVLAEAAERSPGELREAARTFPVLTSILAEAAVGTNTFTGRQASFRLLSVLGIVNDCVATAFYSSLRDVVPVQTTAFENIRFFKEISSAFISKMLEKLKNAECPTTCYLTAQFLFAVAHNVFLPAESRHQIISGWQDALVIAGMHRDVRIVTTRKESEGEAYRLVNLGRLDRLLYQHLLELSGVAL